MTNTQSQNFRDSLNWQDFDEWLCLVLETEETEQNYFNRSALFRSLDNAHIRACDDVEVLQCFIDLVQQARRGGLCAAAGLTKHLTRNRVTSLAHEAESQIARLLLDSDAEQSALDGDLELLKLCMAAAR